MKRKTQLLSLRIFNKGIFGREMVFPKIGNPFKQTRRYNQLTDVVKRLAKIELWEKRNPKKHQDIIDRIMGRK